MMRINIKPNTITFNTAIQARSLQPGHLLSAAHTPGLKGVARVGRHASAARNGRKQ